jgi:hypothetical protein
MANKVLRGGKSVQVQRERKQGWTKRKREAFLAHLATTCNVRASCRKVRMSEAGFYKLKQRDPDFRRNYGAVIAEAYEGLELRYLERGIHGTKRPVFQGGVKVGEVTEYPDRVALVLLSAHRNTALAAREADRARQDELELARLRFAERLSDMNRRMGGSG